MFHNLQKFHQQRTQNLNNMFNQTQMQSQNRQMRGMNNQFPQQTSRMQPQFGHNPNFNRQPNPQMQNRGNMGMTQGNGSYFGGGQNYNRNQQIIGYLNRIKNRVIQDLNEAQMTYRDQTNFNNTSNLCLSIEVFIKINGKMVGAIVKMNQSFPKNIPRVKLSQTFVHEDIARANNEVKIANICQWNVNKKIPDLLKEIEKYFEISPPENSPELQKLISDIIKINKSISSLKNFNYASFCHNLLNDQLMALKNGDYNCLRSSQEYVAVKEQMFDVSQSLQKMKLEVLELQEEVKEMSEDKKEAIEKFHEKVREYEEIKMNFDDLNMKYDADNIKKFLQDQVNKLMYEREALKEQMLECDADSLANLQDDYLRLTKNMTKYVTLMEKGFAY